MKRLITLRSLCSIVIGALLCAFPYDMAATLVTCIGLLFLLSGLISTVAFFCSHRKESLRLLYPILGIGSALFGILLCIFSTALGRYICFLLAAFLLLAGIVELVSMLHLRSRTHVEQFFFLIPLLIIIATLLVFVLPQRWIGGTTDPQLGAQVVRLVIVGCTCIVYGVYSLLAAVRFRRVRGVETVTDAVEVVDDIPQAEVIDDSDDSRFAPPATNN